MMQKEWLGFPIRLPDGTFVGRISVSIPDDHCMTVPDLDKIIELCTLYKKHLQDAKMRGDYTLAPSHSYWRDRQYQGW